MGKDLTTISQTVSEYDTPPINQVVRGTHSQLAALESTKQKVKSLFQLAKEEHFEDGMESIFSRALVDFVKKRGDIAIEAITETITDNDVNTETASESLRWLGLIEDPATHDSRLRLLEQCLNSLSPHIRDGAVLGLSFLDDPNVIPHLVAAVEQEKYVELREDMKQVLDQLECTLHAHPKNSTKKQMA